MPDTNTPLRRDDLDEREQSEVEARMRLALEQMGSEARPRRDRPTPGLVAAQFAPSRHVAATHAPSSGKSVRAGVLTLPTSPARQNDAVEPDLAEERASRQRVEQALLDAQATIGQLQAVLAQCVQERDAALASGKDKDAVVTALRVELQEQITRAGDAAVATARQAIRDETSSIVSGIESSSGVNVPAGTGKPKRPRAATRAKGPQPVKWWLAHAKRDG